MNHGYEIDNAFRNGNHYCNLHWKKEQQISDIKIHPELSAPKDKEEKKLDKADGLAQQCFGSTGS